ncbi:hypothetical protein [Vibrio furnissii]|uniref:hypothetical protein n=1 Tax=Vibrio furnissii TaxID=29494 RepID=UPI001F557FB6|nr:hypothetical protein [Vibrio furnissii]
MRDDLDAFDEPMDDLDLLGDDLDFDGPAMADELSSLPKTRRCLRAISPTWG